MVEKAGLKGVEVLSVDVFHKYINETLLPDLLKVERHRELIEQTLVANEDKSYTIGATTAHNWMLRAGASREWYRQGYYTDVHEREDVIAMRIEYLKMNRELGWRQGVSLVHSSAQLQPKFHLHPKPELCAT